MKRSSSRLFWRNTSGAVAATYALALIPLIAVSGLAFDYARLAGMDTELQNAADQAALAGATQLDREAGSMVRAVNAIQGSLVRNDTLFSNDGEGKTVGIDTADDALIVFYATRPDAEAETNGFTDPALFADARFVGVTVENRAANYALTPIVGALAANLNASAVAGMGSAICRIPPLMICNPDEDNLSSGGDPNSTFDGGRAGHGVKVVAGPSGGGFWEPGNYGFLDLGNGASGVAEVLGWLGPGGGCTSLNDAETIEPDTEPGLKTGAIDSINTRFDVYQNANTCKAGGTCPAAFNSRKDLVRQADVPPASGKSCSITNNTGGWHETGGQRYLPSIAAPLDPSITPSSMGHPRDMCHAVSTEGDCLGGRFGDGNWDRDAYFRSHYVRTQDTPRGVAGTRWTAADWVYNLTHGSNALPTAPPPTRYQVYLWEIARAGEIVDGVKILDPEPFGATGSAEVRHAKPICSQQYGYSSSTTKPDRRVMTVAVVNCKAEGVKGKTTNVKIASWVDFFVVQPSADRSRTSKSDIYLEVIRETDLSITGQNNSALIRRDVPYLVR